MKKIITVIMSMVMVISLAGCGSPAEEQPEEQIEYEIALVTDAGLIMDGGYSEVAWQAITDFGESEGISHKYYKASEASDKAYKATIESAVSNGAKVIIADGYSFEDVVYDAQKKYENVDFILIDAEPADKDSGKTKIAANTAAIHFASEQAGYLAGYAAVSEGYQNLGFVGSDKQPVIMDYCYGFMQGAEAAAMQTGTRVNIRYHYSTSDEDRDAVYEMVSKWFRGKTEVIFACGSAVEQPVIEAAELTEKKVIAAETDKSRMSDTVITSAIKNISYAIEETLEMYGDDEFPGGAEIAYDAENNGIALEMDNSRLETFDKSDYKAVFKALKSGDIVIKKHDSGDISSLGLVNVKAVEK